MTLSPTHKNFGNILSVILAFLVAMSPLAIDTYLGSMPTMARFFGVELHAIELTVTLYFLGFALGNFFGGPLSDAFGRKTIALIGVTLYGLSALGISYCTKVEHVMILRVFQAFGGGFATVTANVFVRDWYTGKDVARFVTLISMIMMLAPLFAPILGTFIAQHSEWQNIFKYLFIYSTALFIIFITLIPESRDKALLTRKITSDALFSKYKTFFSDKQSVILLMAMSFSMAGLYIFLTNASFIYISHFGVEEAHFPYYFGANVLLNIILSILNTVLLKKYRPRQILSVGLFIQLCAGLVFATACLLGDPSITLVASCIIIFIGSLGLVFGNGSAAILNINPSVSGSANATIGITRFLLSFVIGSVLALLNSGTLLPIAMTMFICTLIGNLLFVYFLRGLKKEEIALSK